MTSPMKKFAPKHEVITVEDLINTRYRDYAKYVMYRRAIPSLMDGLKPGQRKALWTAISFARTKKIKTAALSGYAIAGGNFHHGDASMSATITAMAAPWSNNLPLFDSEGNFGTRAIQEAGAPRYTFVKLSKVFDNWFNDSDVAPKSPDPEDPEPSFYLPIIPWVLVNGISGIAIGFATEILPRDPLQIREWCRILLTGKMNREQFLDIKMTPHFPGFTGTVENDAENPNRWITYGSYEKVKRGVLRVTDVPWGVDREAYVKKLETMVERGVIRSYTDLGRLKFEIRAPGIDKWSHSQVISNLKLRSSMTENIVVINEKGELVQYTSPNVLLLDWLDRRAVYYQKRIERNVEKCLEKISLLESKLIFINHVMDSDIDFREVTRESLTETIIRLSVPEKHVDSLLRLPILKFNPDGYNEFNVELDKEKETMEYWETTTANEEHLNDLGK